MQRNETCPAISVLMGVYYRSSDTSGLRRSIASVLSQTYTDFEFLICDDGSSETAQALTTEFAQKDSRVRLIRKGKLIKLPEKLNACLWEAKGSYIARMDDDDYAHADRFERQMAFLAENRDVDFVGCNVNLYCAGKIIGVRKLPDYPTVRDFLFVQPYIHPTLIFRSEALESVGGYSEDKHCVLCEDYDLLLRLYEQGYSGANLQDFLFDYSISATARGNRKMADRWNETVTRYRHFSRLHLLPRAWPYVIKPLAVGFLPENILRLLKQRQAFR